MIKIDSKLYDALPELYRITVDMLLKNGKAELMDEDKNKNQI